MLQDREKQSVWWVLTLVRVRLDTITDTNPQCMLVLPILQLTYIKIFMMIISRNDPINFLLCGHWQLVSFSLVSSSSTGLFNEASPLGPFWIRMETQILPRWRPQYRPLWASFWFFRSIYVKSRWALYARSTVGGKHLRGSEAQFIRTQADWDQEVHS